MNVKFYRPARLMSFVLAATVAFGPTAMAADSLVNEQDVQPTVVNEQDAPVVVSNLITGTALGLGTVNVLGVNVRENPTTDADIVATLDQEQQVVVLSKDGDWYRVSCDGIYGFVHSDYMTVANAGTADLGYGLVRWMWMAPPAMSAATWWTPPPRSPLRRSMITRSSTSPRPT